MSKTTPLSMITPTQLNRRTVLKGITLGAGAVLLEPFLQRLAAEQAGKAPPKRFIFFLESNGMYPYHVQPKGVDMKASGNSSICRSLTWNCTRRLNR